MAADLMADKTTNLLAELREERPDVSWCGRGGLFQRAADEIERLQALVAEMTQNAVEAQR